LRHSLEAAVISHSGGCTIHYRKKEQFSIAPCTPGSCRLCETHCDTRRTLYYIPPKDKYEKKPKRKPTCSICLVRILKCTHIRDVTVNFEEGLAKLQLIIFADPNLHVRSIRIILCPHIAGPTALLALICQPAVLGCKTIFIRPNGTYRIG
jgi:hypothetical protein